MSQLTCVKISLVRPSIKAVSLDLTPFSEKVEPLISMTIEISRFAARFQRISFLNYNEQ